MAPGPNQRSISSPPPGRPSGPALWAALVLVASAGLQCQRAEPPEPVGRCPLVPLALKLDRPGQPSLEVLRLDARGRLFVSLAGLEPVARFYPEGCLVGDDGVWVELTTAGDLWTLRQRFAVRDGALDVGPRTMRIDPDGRLRFSDDSQEKDELIGTLRYEGYVPRAACLARVLFTAYLSMMPSMAVSDGHPPELPLPADSVCRRFAPPPPAGRVHE